MVMKNGIAVKTRHLQLTDVATIVSNKTMVLPALNNSPYHMAVCFFSHKNV